MKTNKIKIRIENQTDIYFAQTEASKIVKLMGFNHNEIIKIKTIVSELAFNIIKYAQYGFITITNICERGKTGVSIKAEDRGPGITDINTALRDNYSTGGTLGLGLPGIKRLSDYFVINTSIGKGTEVLVKIWLK